MSRGGEVVRLRMDGVLVLLLKVADGEGVLMVDGRPEWNIRVSSELI